MDVSSVEIDRAHAMERDNLVKHQCEEKGSKLDK